MTKPITTTHCPDCSGYLLTDTLIDKHTAHSVLECAKCGLLRTTLIGVRDGWTHPWRLGRASEGAAGKVLKDILGVPAYYRSVK